MALLTWVGTIASVLGLMAAIAAGLKARSASRAAEEAVKQLKHLQAPWTARGLGVYLGILREAVARREWGSAEALAASGLAMALELRTYLADRLAEPEAQTFSDICFQLRLIVQTVKRLASVAEATPEPLDVAIVETSLARAEDLVAEITGTLRRRGEASDRGGVRHD